MSEGSASLLDLATDDIPPGSRTGIRNTSSYLLSTPLTSTNPPISSFRDRPDGDALEHVRGDAFSLPLASRLEAENGQTMTGSLSKSDRNCQPSRYAPSPMSPIVYVSEAEHISTLQPANETLIDLFYTNFHDGHPFLIPQALYRMNPTIMPAHLKTVIELLATHFADGHLVDDCAQQSLLERAQDIRSSLVPDDGFKVQGLLLLGMTLYACSDTELALTTLDQAIDTALKLGMNHHEFALKNSRGNSILGESWRRTWWELYMLSGTMTALSNAQCPFILRDTPTDMPLPCEDSDYAQCKPIASLRAQSDFQERTFAPDPYKYSSLAYKIEAIRLTGIAMSLGDDVDVTTDGLVEGVEASLMNFIFSVPPEKRYLDTNDVIDEVMFSALTMIDCALILLHRPRSSLIFVRRHYPTPCSKAQGVAPPSFAREIHTSKTIKAANSISNAISMRTPLTRHSPCFICAIALAAVIHLPAYILEARRDRSGATKDRLALAVSALNLMSKTWPMAKAVKAEILQFAHDVFATRTAVDDYACRAELQIEELNVDSFMHDQSSLEGLTGFEPLTDSALAVSVPVEYFA